MIIQCPHCHTGNRLEAARLAEGPNCGACHQALIHGVPFAGTADNLGELIKASRVPVVVDFWAPWCGPCVSFAPAFAAAAQAFAGKALFVKVDTEAQPALGTQFQVRSIPTIAVFDNGQELERTSGALPPGQFKAWLMQFF
ncbi:thioredoxin TrxC [Chitiniphilus purpureus]|uniref:Thioredoxin n=1 Tax=Chitiniphilus purpureus TaxID=2981137 RepID=A0ABY6DJ96_9NEIS|nr:thioredoxin TrxC [Chitiniphilus sp. CD1]UXY14431.1 thioredoxin TrxC [Chitiniphilus sp. CD1]